MFNFVWASEEYPEYSNSSFNDSFGFFLSGPGLSGPYSNNAENIALIPGTTLPITINNVNNGGNGITGPCEYCEFYIHNPQGTDATAIEYDGFTTVITAEAEVQCGETYHIKIALADAGDTSWDSAVFFEAGSFTSNQIDFDLQIVDMAQNDSTLFEGCGINNLVFTRGTSNPDEQDFMIEMSGTAINGTDYTFIPDTLTFADGEYELILPFEAFGDGIVEGVETIILEFTNFLDCSAEAETTVFEFYIGEPEPLALSYLNPTIDCNESVLLEVTPSGGYGVYEGEWGDGTLGYELFVSPDQTEVFQFTLSDTCGITSIVEDVLVNIPIYPDLLVDIGADQELFCMDDLTVLSEVSGGFGAYSYFWMVDNLVVSTDDLLQYATDDEVTVTLTVYDECGVDESDVMEVTFPPVSVLVDLGADIDVTCIDNTALSAIVEGGVGAFTYSWTISGNEVGTTPTYTVQTDDEIAVMLTVTDQCENEGFDEIIIDVPAVPVSVDLGPDLIVTCLDENTLDAVVSGGIGGYNYEWILQNTVVSDDPTIDVQTDVQLAYTLVVTDACGNEMSDNIVLEAPPVPIGVNLGQDLFVSCVDNTLLDPNPTGGVGNFSYSWTMEGLDLGDDETVVVNTEVDVEVVVFITDECGNVGADEISLIIPEYPVGLTISADTAICLGEAITLHVDGIGGAGNISYYWDQAQAFGAAIPVSPAQTTLYTVYAHDECGNSAQAQVLVGVEEVIANFDFDYVGAWGLQMYNASTNGATFFWDFNDGDTSDEVNPLHSYHDLYDHTITLYAEGPLGCVDSISDVFIPVANLYVPSAFTPNNDGINDFFKVEGHDIFSFEIWVYNRWGELVYNSRDLDDVWDGSDRGGEYYVKDGVYVYTLKAVGIRENGIEETGTVTVYR